MIYDFAPNADLIFVNKGINAIDSLFDAKVE